MKHQMIDYFLLTLIEYVSKLFKADMLVSINICLSNHLSKFIIRKNQPNPTNSKLILKIPKPFIITNLVSTYLISEVDTKPFPSWNGEFNFWARNFTYLVKHSEGLFKIFRCFFFSLSFYHQLYKLSKVNRPWAIRISILEHNLNTNKKPINLVFLYSCSS